MSLDELIESVEIKLTNHQLTSFTRLREESILRELKGKRQLLKLITDEMLPGRKFCYRYGHMVVESCNVCEFCLQPGNLANNEGDE